MAIMITDDKHYKAIAEVLKPYDSMAEMNGILPEEMPDYMDIAFGIEYADGFNSGEQSGIREEKDSFWQMYQDKGKRETYTYAFSYVWNNAFFQPRYDINAKNAPGMFRECKITDLKALLKRHGVSMNINAADITYFARLSTITKFPELGLNLTNITHAFSNCDQLVSIDKLNTIKTAECNCSNAFNACGKLQYVEFNEKFNPTNLNLSGSPLLRKDCILSLFNNLVTTKISKVITLGAINLNKLTDAEKAIATNKGWSLV